MHWGVSLIQLQSTHPWAHLSKDSLCMHSPSVQFLESSRVPLQSRPPFWGGGAMHSRLRQWAHSVLQADHLLHSVHAPSTAGAQHMVHRNIHVHRHMHTVTWAEHSNVPLVPTPPYIHTPQGRERKT